MIKLSRLMYALPLVLLALIVFFVWRGLHINPHLLPSTLINKKIPTFSLARLTKPHKTFTNKNFQGHVSLLNVWASWCISCQFEHPELMKIARTQIVSMYGLDYKDNPNDARALLHQHGNPYQSIGNDEKGDVAINFGVYGTPESFLIDQQSVIRYKHIGPITNIVWMHDLLPRIRILTKKKALK